MSLSEKVERMETALKNATDVSVELMREVFRLQNMLRDIEDICDGVAVSENTDYFVKKLGRDIRAVLKGEQP